MRDACMRLVLSDCILICLLLLQSPTERIFHFGACYISKKIQKIARRIENGTILHFSPIVQLRYDESSCEV